MENKKKYRSRLLFSGLIIYVILACIWWSLLLFEQNEQLRASHLDNLRTELVLIKGYSDHDFTQSLEYQSLIKSYERKKWQIVGEGLVFFVMLLIGIFALNRGFRKEVALARQQRNFLLSITHELKSPLASIKLAFETFRKHPNLKPEQIATLSRNALKETDRLHDLVNNILLAARIESSMEISPAELDLIELLDGILNQLQAKFPNVAFHFNSPDDLLLVYADRLALSSVLINLLENAVKYASSDSDITIQAFPQGKNVVVEIADKGIGIPDDQKSKIFEKFYRIGNEDTRKTKGTGLGLFIVKSMVEAHHGSVQVRDNLPKGTVFKVTLPQLS